MTPLLSNALLRAQSDDRLIALAAAGHDRAFEAIVERYRRPLLRHVRRFLPDTRAEDVVQAAFVSAWGSLRDGTEVRELRPWLYRIASNGALNALKRAGADDAPLGVMAEARGSGGDPGIEVERRDAARRALTGLAALPQRQRDALVATALAGRPHAEVAAELGMTDGALRQLVHRARCQLRAVATVLTPPPMLAAAATHELTAARVAEVAAGAGGAGLAAAGMKMGAVAATAGALVVGAPRVADVAKGPATVPPAAAETRSGNAGQTTPDASAASGDITYVAADGAAAKGGSRRGNAGRRKARADGSSRQGGATTGGSGRAVRDDSSHGDTQQQDDSGERRHRGGRSHGSDDHADDAASTDDAAKDAAEPGDSATDDSPKPEDSPTSGSSGSGSGSGSPDDAPHAPEPGDDGSAEPMTPVAPVSPAPSAPADGS